MSDLISREALIEMIVNTPTEESGYNPVYLSGCATRQLEILNIIDDAPTVEAVPVVHGEWLDMNTKIFTELGTMEVLLCSNCKCEIVIESFGNFCPNCGADMRSITE